MRVALAGVHQFHATKPMHRLAGPLGVTASTLDPESSDRDSNPREAFNMHGLYPTFEDQLIVRAFHALFLLRATLCF